MSIREVALSTKYMMSLSGLQPIPLAMVQPVSTGIGPVSSNRYNDEAPGVKSYAMVPAQSRPSGSHLASFMRTRGLSASTGTRSVVVSSPQE